MIQRFLVIATFRVSSIPLDDATVWKPAKREAEYLFDPAPTPAHPEIKPISFSGRLSDPGGWVAILTVDDNNDPRQALDTWLAGRGADAADTGHLGQLFDYEIEPLFNNQDVQNFVPVAALSPGHSW